MSITCISKKTCTISYGAFNLHKICYTQFFQNYFHLLEMPLQQEWPNFDLRAKFATAWPQVDRIQCEVNKRQVAANAVALLSRVRNMVLEKNVQGVWRAGCSLRTVVWPILLCSLPQTLLWQISFRNLLFK